MKRATVTINLVEEERGEALREQSAERCHYYKGEQIQIQSKNTNTYTNTVGNMDRTITREGKYKYKYNDRYRNTNS